MNFIYTAFWNVLGIMLFFSLLGTIAWCVYDAGKESDQANAK
ncbi:hypothetical protein ERICIV_04588 (plasmid) [Paenibacillus larvae subsp. larvae]|uniref:Uncharacterized protein n=1 Tax=Paenibacillus larvae subsp. larvae TaxID=147375 RepID=A0A2L1UKA0_9BACL|nr:hypothetical protein [Paenibacillus larvae]AVF28970.1 hypothetical protein ERICIII_04969 [Paenibacillus larvae subsp. larvae]AVF33351.1 hypothetical protein ERICIV_04588 [Paenibacillus larvae subsp. larvae]MDR5608861.1 hypothetical protein [Paenibacillus larvae]MEC0088091.1 hypothetical protein [Paenibacillus larvae]MEC0188922.1 hypothetical protein [Paenibacillus larvae]